MIRELLLGKQENKKGSTTPSTIVNDDDDEDEALTPAETKSSTTESTPSAWKKDVSTDADTNPKESKAEDLSQALVVVPEKAEAKNEFDEERYSDHKERHLPTVAKEDKPAPSTEAINHPPASVLGSNGQPICNLKDHRVLAGCTAIVAMLVGNRLIVANAGDSRGVLSRQGKALALSEDHKPRDDREFQRITEAGGFVTAVGRINGNLNLSRSLGDLKYKSLKHLPPEAQVSSSLYL